MSDEQKREKKLLSRREFLKAAGLTVAGVAASSILGSCGPGEATEAPTATSQGPTATPTAEPVNVVWWTEAVPESIQQSIVEEFVEPFNESHPHVNLELQFMAELVDKVKTAVAGGGGPDIIETVGPTVASEFYTNGYTISLTDFADQYGWRDIMHDWAIKYGTVGGELVSLQLTQETMMMVYNKGLLEEKGWSIPTTPDELVNVVENCLSEGIVPFASHSSMPLYHTTIWNDYASALSVYKWLSGEIPFTSEEFVGAADFLRMMLEEEWMGDKVWDLGFGDEWALLATDQALMKIDGSWAFKSGADAFEEFEWDVAPLPNLREGITHTWALGSGEALSIAADSENPEAVAEVLNYIYSNPARAGKLMAAHPGEWVVPIKIEQDDIPDTLDPRQQKVIVWMNEAGAEDKIGYLTWSSWPPKTLGVSMDYAGAHARGEMSSEDFCAEIQSQFEDDLEAGEVMDIPVTAGA